jgi:hypothetical protein
MFGLVELGVGLLGAGLNTYQAIQSQKQMKQAAQAKSQAQQQLRNIKEFNAFKAVQVPTLGFNLAQESKAQGMAQGVEALKGMGAEGAGNVVGLVQAGFGQDLALAAQAQEAQFKRDAMQAEAEQGIQQRQAERDFAIGAYDLQTAQEQQNAAQANRNQAIEGIFTSLGSAALGAYQGSDLYKNKGATTRFNVGDTPGIGQPGSGVMAYKGNPTSQNYNMWTGLPE